MTPEQGTPATDNPGSLEDPIMALEGLLEREEAEEEAGEAATGETPKPKAPVKAEPAPEKTPPEEEPEGESAEEAPTEEGEASEEQGQEPKLYTVKVDGETAEVDLPELIKGYQIQKHVTRQSMALAEERKAIQQEREKYAQVLPVLLKQLEQGGDKEPDWEALRAEDEFKFVVERQAWQVKQEQRAAVRAEIQQTQALQQKDNEKALEAKVAEGQQKLLKAVPAWKDAKKFEADKAEIREYLMSHDYSEEEVKGTYDPRAVIISRKAMLYDKLVNAQLKAAPNKGPRTASAGSASATPGRTADYARMKSRVKETGSVDDAAKLFEQADL